MKGVGCHLDSCDAERERLCPVCGWWTCMDAAHAVEQHGRCASRWERADDYQRAQWAAEAAGDQRGPRWRGGA